LITFSFGMKDLSLLRGSILAWMAAQFVAVSFKTRGAPSLPGSTWRRDAGLAIRAVIQRTKDAVI
jgi:hypothetical protein